MAITRAKHEEIGKLILRFMRRKKPRNTCCPITLEKLGTKPPYYLLFENDLLYVFEAEALSVSCQTSGPYSPISRRKLLSVELRRLARCVGVNVEDLQQKDEEGEVDVDSIISFLSEEVGSVIDSITFHLNSFEDTESVLDREHGHLCQSIVNLCQVSMASAQEVLQTHIRRVQLMSTRAQWVSAQAAALLIDELRHLRQMTVDSPNTHSIHQTIRRALRVMQSESRRAQQIEVDQQLANYVDTGIPASIRNPPQRIVFSNPNEGQQVWDLTPVNLVEILQQFEHRRSTTTSPLFQIRSLVQAADTSMDTTDSSSSSSSSTRPSSS